MGSVMEVQVALFCLIIAVMCQQPEGLAKYYRADYVGDSNFTLHSRCKNSVCIPGYHCDDLGECKRCPDPGSECESCCYLPHMYACDGKSNKTCVCTSCVCEGSCYDSFILAAQIALGAALTIAFLALIFLLWKTCRRPNGSRRHVSSFRERESSLTSVQRFVQQRLRDRPPRYEDTNQIQLEKPPEYQEADTDSVVPDIWSTSPPPYSEALHSSTNSTLIEDNEPVQQANVSMESDTRTQGKVENRMSDSCQSGRADNIRYAPHEARPTQHSETELHM